MKTGLTIFIAVMVALVVYNIFFKENIKIDGHYLGDMRVEQNSSTYEIPVRFRLSLYEDAIIGSWQTDEQKGTIKADFEQSKFYRWIASKSRIRFVLLQSEPCTLSYSGTAVVEKKGDRIFGSLSGNYCEGSPFSIDFDVTKFGSGAPADPF